jgi:formamidopyrimidine-DNA glycosylase
VIVKNEDRMFELPEYRKLAGQLNSTVKGKIVLQGRLGNSPHKFVWYNRSPAEFEALTEGKRVGDAVVRGRWLMLDLDPGYRLVLGECGGRLLFHPAGEGLPAKYHLCITFSDRSALTVMTTMWGAMELFAAGRELERQYIKDMRPTPVDPQFTRSYFSNLIDQLNLAGKRSVKSLLTQEQLIPGLGNAIAQDILFTAHLHPRHPMADLSPQQRDVLFSAILDTVRSVTEAGGRNDETDLFGKPGSYQRIMDSRAAGKPCPRCGTGVVKLQYLGGACYCCPGCQT